MKGAKASEDLRSIGLWNSRDDYKSDVVVDQISPSAKVLAHRKMCLFYLSARDLNASDGGGVATRVVVDQISPSAVYMSIL